MRPWQILMSNYRWRSAENSSRGKKDLLTRLRQNWSSGRMPPILLFGHQWRTSSDDLVREGFRSPRPSHNLPESNVFWEWKNSGFRPLREERGTPLSKISTSLFRLKIWKFRHPLMELVRDWGFQTLPKTSSCTIQTGWEVLIKKPVLHQNVSTPRCALPRSNYQSDLSG